MSATSTTSTTSATSATGLQRAPPFTWRAAVNSKELELLLPCCSTRPLHGYSPASWAAPGGGGLEVEGRGGSSAAQGRAKALLYPLRYTGTHIRTLCMQWEGSRNFDRNLLYGPSPPVACLRRTNTTEYCMHELYCPTGALATMALGPFRTWPSETQPRPTSSNHQGRCSA